VLCHCSLQPGHVQGKELHCCSSLQCKGSGKCACMHEQCTHARAVTCSCEDCHAQPACCNADFSRHCGVCKLLMEVSVVNCYVSLLVTHLYALKVAAARCCSSRSAGRAAVWRYCCCCCCWCCCCSAVSSVFALRAAAAEVTATSGRRVISILQQHKQEAAHRTHNNKESVYMHARAQLHLGTITCRANLTLLLYQCLHIRMPNVYRLYQQHAVCSNATLATIQCERAIA
jgi:hypothetical protein